MDSILSDKKFEKIRPLFEEKQNVYNTYRKFYNGSIYFDRAQTNVWKLYAGIKMFYNILSRAVDMDTHLIPNKFSLVTNTPDKALNQVEQIREWSNWNAEEYLYVHYGALYGDSYLKVIDTPNKVMVKPVDPRYVWLQEDYGLIVYKNMFGDEIAEYYTPKTITLYKNAKVTNSYKNIQGQIPLIHVQHKDLGGDYGSNTFHNILPQINVINELTSILEDAIIRNVNPIFVIAGAIPTDIERDADKAMFVPDGVKVETISPSLAINQVLEFIKDVKQEAKDGLPELAFDDLRAKERLAAETLEVQLKELAVKILRCRANYDNGYERAMEMAFQAATIRELRMDDIKNKPGFEVVKIKVDFDRPTIPLSIREELSIDLIKAQMLATLVNVPGGAELVGANFPQQISVTQTLNGEQNDQPAGNSGE